MFIKQKYNLEADFKAFNEADRLKIRKAFDYANTMHKDQKRKSGKDYISHPYNVSLILRDLNMDSDVISVGLLHDVVEDTKVSKKDLEEYFSPGTASLVESVTNLSKVDFSDIGDPEEFINQKQQKKIEGLRKLFLAMSGDIRVVIIKLADRLHNMRTLEFLEEKDQKRIANETLEIFVPLANRLGMGAMKSELEDLAFKYSFTEKYKEIVKITKEAYKSKEHFLKKMEKFIKKELAFQGIQGFKVESRAKTYHSIYKKLKKTNGDISAIHDLMALRIIVEEVEDCYKTLGLIHSHFKPLIYRIKDYIAVPKPNGYKSLHTTVFGVDGIIFEIQIRTTDFHNEAERGVAAHWFYDDSKKASGYKKRQASIVPKDEINWVKELLNMQEDAKNNEEFMEGLKIDIFRDRIFVFSPQGDIFDLPEGATSVDFAFEVHSKIGEKITGAKSNGKIIPIDAKLENRDIVEIIASKSSNGPKRDWLNFVVTSKAKQGIRSYLRNKNKVDNIEIGKKEFVEDLKFYALSLNSLIKEEIALVLDKLTYKTLEDCFAAIGEGSLSSKKFARLFIPEKPKESAKIKISRLSKKEKESSVSVLGSSGLLTNISSCCNPMSGDEIKGYITKGKGISIHKKNCGNIINAKKDRVLEASWTTKNQEILLSYEITMLDRVGLLRDISEAISAVGLNILSINIVQNENKEVTINVKMSGKTKEQYSSLDRRLPIIKNVIGFKIIK